ncbi:hypothetical protein [Hyalangium versicolor]|uniref:hypothetical protein n=1 Tax=Hyalangium versicolor TaxID=2861190 RepID=UPI001CCDCBE8|nr:hypothetical protein [Hyalangium versicolor]
MKNNKLGMRKEALRTINDQELDNVVGGLASSVEVSVGVGVGPVEVSVGVGISV